MTVVGVVGMPGSGKSRLVGEYKAKGYALFDDINRDWHGNIPKVKGLIAAGQDIIVSDIEFCNQDRREQLVHDIGRQVEWIFFQNNPYYCALNCCYRFFVEGKNRPIGEEIQKIARLTKVYEPTGLTHPVILADQRLGQK